MKRETYDDYVRRFNAQDTSGFDLYLHPDVRVQNGLISYTGIQGMKDHYAKIWRTYKETLNVLRYVSDEQTAAVELWTHFDALRDAEDTPLGPVRAGETFDYRGVVLYEIQNGRFTSIKVSYLSFTHTDLKGKQAARIV